ncbi:hypothetical protein [Chryseobacterium sp. FH2]|uniref:hypothetical protein n=1 Tax=Chryseobacterium sp. FH2 TaxID=1674291 RepID=UPI00065AE301|nr:hypothetical protein [Chryseobacterium sp. FH2]
MKLQKNIFFCLLFIAVFGYAQEKTADSAEFAHFDCGITQTKQKLDKYFFASTPPVELRVNNKELTYTTFQLGKRKNKLYLYLRILEDNVCIKKDKNVDVYFKSGEVITFKNEYPLNCDAFFAKQLKKKEIQKMRENEITLIKIYTYKKNYEMYVNEVQNQDIYHYIDCLSGYKIKKSDEVKVKKDNKREKREEPNIIN